MDIVIAREGSHELLATFKRERGEQLRITLTRYRRETFVLQHFWYADRGVYRPGLRGLSLTALEIEPMACALATAAERVRI